jgi:copper(I)-binding protein
MTLAKSAALLAALALAPIPLAAHDAVLAQANGIVVEDGYVRATGAGARTAAAYMRITNETGSDDRLLEVQSDAAERVELHATETKDGVARMLPLDGLPVPAHAAVQLESRRTHMMLMGLTGPLQDGDSVALTLVFEHAGAIPVALPVGIPGTDHHGETDGHMDMHD